MSMIFDYLQRLFSGPPSTSRQQVKNRLKLVLAHDRSDLPPAVLEAMREEILAVVSRYVELDKEAMEFSLETNQRATALIANLPIRSIHKTPLSKEEGAASAATVVSSVAGTPNNASAAVDFSQLNEFAESASANLEPIELTEVTPTAETTSPSTPPIADSGSTLPPTAGTGFNS